MKLGRLSLLLVTVQLGCASGAVPVSSAAGDRQTMTILDAGQPVNITIDRDPSSHQVAASLNSAWNSIAPVYEALGIPLEYADLRTHRTGNTRFVVSRQLAGQPMSKMLRCGEGITGALADSYRIQMSIWTELKSIDAENTAVFTRIEAKGSSVSGTGSTVNCITTGMLESAIVKLLKQRVVVVKG
jgi:hypothetical protein